MLLLVLRAVAGGALIALVPLLARTHGPVVAGLIMMAPVVTLVTMTPAATRWLCRGQSDSTCGPVGACPAGVVPCHRDDVRTPAGRVRGHGSWAASLVDTGAASAPVAGGDDRRLRRCAAGPGAHPLASAESSAAHRPGSCSRCRSLRCGRAGRYVTRKATAQRWRLMSARHPERGVVSGWAGAPRAVTRSLPLVRSLFVSSPARTAGVRDVTSPL